ncbi:MSMEG_1061 family FMN-dependent PPOX-type flavoprotein [Psychromarinibacter halotolerans]|uniref:MSMEG_1061 family FMN-dependent PPOX-type flavoprotein n=1 Tax=Psychromarinibacter halotolerans TaxID=1775175 RepID=A0ABV7GQB4_9RHOB|nr:MSMEG_1061 family FMN-dependent PPOX-type flavoprotein [Psychromarinibacter halotolerans]MDF0598941.1 pyridoxamine 5'-phosphate oxidase family protein [Psychromarinibacter halotolerans]
MPSVFGYEVDEAITSPEQLRQHYKMPSRYVSDKVIDHIDPLAERFLAATSLVFLSTRRADGQINLSPRGDPAGFLHVLSPRLLALPDRMGNNRTDAFEDILRDPQVGLICVIPGHRDTLRISGEARLVRDTALCETLSVQGKPAQSALLIKVNRVLCHCPKAFVRGGVWDADGWPARETIPTLAEMMVAHGALSDSVAEMDAIVKRDGETRLS